MQEHSFSETTTRVLDAHKPEAVAEAAEVVKEGRLAVFPTDTVYGVGGDYQRAEVIERIYWAKQRPRELAIPVLISDPRHVSQVARALPTGYTALAARFWPGDLTIVVPRRPELPAILSAGRDTIAVRMPDHSVALALIEACGGVMAVTSANLSGQPSPQTAEDALRNLEGRVALVLDGGTCLKGVASSIIDLASDPPRLLREGKLSLETLRGIVPSLERP